MEMSRNHRAFLFALLRFAAASQESAEPSRIIGRDSMRGNERRDDARNRYVLIIRRLRIRRFD